MEEVDRGVRPGQRRHREGGDRQRLHDIEIELGSSDPIDQLRGLRAADRQLDLWQRQTITRARAQGSSWAQIGDAPGMTKQAAWAHYSEGVRDALAAVRQRSGLTDEQAQRLADEERDALRSQ